MVVYDFNNSVKSTNYRPSNIKHSNVSCDVQIFRAEHRYYLQLSVFLNNINLIEKFAPSKPLMYVILVILQVVHVRHHLLIHVLERQRLSDDRPMRRKGNLKQLKLACESAR